MNEMIQQAVTILKQGGLVAMPTETVYGLAADASNPAAVKKIYEAKGRPSSHPVIVHIASIEQMDGWARDVPQNVKNALAEFWPGPLTIICKKAPHVSTELTGGQDTVGIRVPNHPVAQCLLQAFGGGLAAPSANRFGRISPTAAADVKAELGEKVDLILEGGRSKVGIESTILDISQKPYRILRLGAISAKQLSQSLGEPVEELIDAKSTIRAPGMLASHYAPITPVQLIASEKLQAELSKLVHNHDSIGLLTHSKLDLGLATIRYVHASSNPERYAHELYANLRLLDSEAHTVIVVEAVPDTAEWAAIADRLKRAAY
ncbi:MAG: L-threonylcarbamoyladenylate synthase [Gammaproteobacteria bacterium]|nr:L-threonylcarbamoyladenylate synthase [Gammaproteobacteria bacterium]